MSNIALVHWDSRIWDGWIGRQSIGLWHWTCLFLLIMAMKVPLLSSNYFNPNCDLFLTKLFVPKCRIIRYQNQFLWCVVWSCRKSKVLIVIPNGHSGRQIEEPAVIGRRVGVPLFKYKDECIPFQTVYPWRNIVLKSVAHMTSEIVA